MSVIVTRSGKGSPLTHTEVDDNFTNLNTDKYQSGDAVSFSTLTATGQTSLGGAAGSEGLRVNTTASAVNYAQIQGNTATNAPVVSAQGADSNIGLVVSSKGTGRIGFFTNNISLEQLRVSHTASAVNYVQVTGGATGLPPVVSAQGSDASPNLAFQVKGGAAFNFYSQGGLSYRHFRIDGTGNAVNAFQVNGSVATQSPVMSVLGTDTNISQVFQSKGTGAIDLAAGSSGVNISNGGTVTALTRTALGSGYTTVPSLTISAPTTAGGVQATASPLMALSTIAINAGGTGYTVNDVLTLSGGTFSSAATLTVTSVSGGVITGVSVTTNGSYSVLPTSPISVTGGTGTGATFTTATWYLAGGVATITNAGSGYVEQPTVTFSGGGGSGAAAYATVGSGTVIRSLAQTVDFYVPDGIGFRVSGTASSGGAYLTAFASATTPILRGTGSGTFAIQAASAIPIQFQTNASSSAVEQFRVAHTASAVNYVQVTGAATGSGPTISAQGSDAASNLTLTSKSGGDLLLHTGGSGGYVYLRPNQVSTLRAVATASGVNLFQVAAGIAGAAPTLSAIGSDTNIDLSLTPKGTGSVVLGNNQANYYKITGGDGSTTNPRISVDGSSTNTSAQIASKGTGVIQFITGGSSNLEQLRVAHTASAVNYVQVTGAATGGSSLISAQGSDASTGLSFQTKGDAYSRFYSSSGYVHFRIYSPSAIASVNYFQTGGSITGLSPVLSAVGTDTNISQVFQSKGTGAIDLAAGSLGVNISNGGTVTAITNSSTGFGYTTQANATISAPTTAGGVQATATVRMGINTASVASGGTGYTVGDVLTVVGGTPVSAAATLTVSSVSGGVITSVNSTNFSAYTVLPASPVSVTGGTGSGATFNPLWFTAGFTITNAGSGYVEQPTVSFSGGGGSGAAAIATVGSDTIIKSLGNSINFQTPGSLVSTQPAFSIRGGAGSIANYISTIPATTGGGTYLGVIGSDTNANIVWHTKGTGVHYFNTNNGAQTQLTVTHTASAVNYVQVTGAATGSTPSISAQGSDSNAGLTIQAKGTAGVNIGNGTYFKALEVTAGGVANYIQIASKATGVAPTISAQGSDTNIPIVLQPKGTGALQAQQTDSTATGGNARGANAVDWQTARSVAGNVASGGYSIVGGGNGNTASTSYAAAFSGLGNSATGVVSVIAGGQGNISNGNYSALVGGVGNTSSGWFNFIGAGFTNSGTANGAVTTQSGTMNGTTAVTLSGSNASIKVGQYITGTSIAGDTYVAAVSGTSLTLSKVASGSSTSTLSFYTPHGVVVGGGNNQATGAYSFIGGGGDAGTAANRNVASGDWSFVGGGVKNVASGVGSVIAGGGTFSDGSISGNAASGAASAITGGRGHTASGSQSFIGGGFIHVASGSNSVVAGGYVNTANGEYSAILGGVRGTTRAIQGFQAAPAHVNPIADVPGVSQSGLLIIGRQTTDATATVLTSNIGAAATNNQVILPNNSAYYFKGSVVAGVTGAGDTSSWSFEGTIKRGANAASTALVGTPALNLIGQDAGASTWAVALTADTTNGGLAVTVTGQAATTIRWVCKIETTEMTF